MLSRTANNLYWMARYVERAENTARILDVTYRMSLMPQDAKLVKQEWFAPLNITGTLFPFSGRYSTVSAHDVLRYMVLDPDNPSSIYSCARAARENARAVRGSITSEMWEVLNTTWLELQRMNESRLDSAGRDRVLRLGEGPLASVPRRDRRHRAARPGLPLQPAGHLPRARRQHRAHPRREVPRAAAQRGGRGRRGRLLPVGARCCARVSAFESYRKVYRDVITPLRVAELLILRDDMPRSLHACMNEVYDILQLLATAQAKEAVRLAGELHAELHFGRIEKIFGMGLHEYLTDFLNRTNTLGAEINSGFFTV